MAINKLNMPYLPIGKSLKTVCFPLTPQKHDYCFVVPVRPFRHKIKYRLSVFYEWALLEHAADEELHIRFCKGFDTYGQFDTNCENYNIKYNIFFTY